MKWVLVGLGGMLGSLGRYGIGLLLQRFTDSMSFPVGILAVNVVGCFVAGVLLGRTDMGATLTDEWRVFLIVGVLGGFTTFSAFGVDTHAFLQDRELTRALINVAANVLLGVCAVWLGFQIATPARG